MGKDAARSPLSQDPAGAHKANVKFADFLKLLEAFGFAYRRTRGSHMIYENRAAGFTMSVQPGNSGDAKVLQINEFLGMIWIGGLRMDDDGK